MTIGPTTLMLTKCVSTKLICQWAPSSSLSIYQGAFLRFTTCPSPVSTKFMEDSDMLHGVMDVC